MDNNPIGIFDSSVGGLTSLVQVSRILPNESLLYFGDSKRMPYGNRNPQELVSFANGIIAFLESRNAKVILVACNTISSLIGQLNAKVPLISIVEAGAKAAYDTGEEHIGVIATVATVSSGVYEREIAKLNPAIKVTSSSSVYLPKIIDSYIDDISLIRDNIKACLDPILAADPKVRTVVLGCSHFPIILNEITELYPNLTFIDPAIEHARMLNVFLRSDHAYASQDTQREIRIHTTAETYEFAAAVKRLKLEFDSLEKVKLPGFDL